MIEPSPTTDATPDSSFCTVTYFDAGWTSADQVVAAFASYEAMSIGSGAALEVLQRIERPNQFAVVGVWPDESAFHAHMASDVFRELSQSLAPSLAAPSDTRLHLAQSGEVSTPRSSGSLTVVTHVDVVPTAKDSGLQALLALAAASRHHTGNTVFAVWQQTNRLNHFTLVERWSSRELFEAHAMAVETCAFREQLAAMTGALYDERLYRALS